MNTDNLMKVKLALETFEKGLHDVDWMKPFVKVALDKFVEPAVQFETGDYALIRDVLQDFEQRLVELHGELLEETQREKHLVQEALSVMPTREELGWFSIVGYSTQDRFELYGPSHEWEHITSLAVAQSIAERSAQFESCYEVVVLARGTHASYATDQQVWSRNKRACLV